MGAPTIYRSDDPGAPVVTNDSKNGFYEVLKAALVTGYGSKPAAGWSVVYDVWATDGVCTFTNSNQSGVLGLSYNNYGNYGPFIFTASAMIDAVTGLNVRCGRYAADISDLTDSSSGSSNYSLFGFAQSSQCDHWCIIANEHFAICWFSLYHDSLFSADHDSSNYYKIQNIFFGSADSLVGGGSVSQPTGPNFILQGAGQPGNSVYWSMRGDRQGVATINKDGAWVTGECVSWVYPYCATPSGSGLGGANEAAYRNLSVVPVSLFVAEESTAQADSYQTAVLPMLHAVPGFGVAALYSVMAELSIVSLTDTITIGGKNYLWAPFNYGDHVFISLDQADWS